MLKSTSAPNAVKKRIEILSALTQPKVVLPSINEVATECGVPRQFVNRTVARWNSDGLVGLYDRGNRGRRKTRDMGDIATAMEDTSLELRPPKRPTVRQVAEQLGLSKSSASDSLIDFGVWGRGRAESEFCPTEMFDARIIDFVGLYINPPNSAFALCVDDATGDDPRSRPSDDDAKFAFSIGKAIVGGERTGTGARAEVAFRGPLHAALDLGNGGGSVALKQRRHHKGFLRFLSQLEADVPAALSIHVFTGEYRPTTQRRIIDWLDRHPRIHVHEVGTHEKWLKQISRWHRFLMRAQVRGEAQVSPASFSSKIETIFRTHEMRRPFVWVAEHGAILLKWKQAKRK